ncbi:MAG: DUF2309 domain-containing protein [Methylococcales bacterium]|nr:DUF2309 domain-containing protein [Methylococcales bacterium]
MQRTALTSNDSRDLILSALAHINHILPAQAPLQDFVHHNTLHGYQQLSFEQAIAENEAVTGIKGYLPESNYRQFYAQGRINDHDIAAALARYSELDAEKILCSAASKDISKQAILTTALLADLSAISVSQLTWQIEELHALNSVQIDVPEAIAQHYTPQAIRALWEALLLKLDLQHAAYHPETLLDLSLEQTEDWLSDSHSSASIHQQTQQQTLVELGKLFAQVGDELSVRGLVLALSGKDVLDFVRPKLIRVCASVLDEGVAAWHTPNAEQKGLYTAWRETAKYDITLFLHELPDWQQIMSALPEDAIDTIIVHLSAMDIPSEKWAGYLQRIALEIAGWSGMIAWREQHPDYQTNHKVAIKLADYLAIRLTLDRLWLNQICHDLWKVEAKLSCLQHYFRKNLSEFMVRSRLYQGDLPEYLSHQAKSLTTQVNSERSHRQQWQQLADLIWTWQFSPMANHKNHGSTNSPSVFNSGWRLFRLSQHLGLQSNDIQALQITDLQTILMVLDEFSSDERSKVWLTAYESHYRERFFNALRANHNRGRWAVRKTRPEAQLIFCMDEREESFRRHLEEHNAAIETLGAAGFFGVPINYQGLDENNVTALCPVVVIPSHEVREIPLPDTENAVEQHNRGRKLNQSLSRLLLQSSRTNPLLSYPVIDLFAPFTLVSLLAKTLVPKTQQQFIASMMNKVSPLVDTQLHFTADDDAPIATPAQPRLGFTDSEQADRVTNLLRVMGLTDVFAPLVVLFGHGSISQNNPHRAAYNCGACSGRHGGPNARVFAAMANRPEIRHLLAKRGINIPTDTWFIGAEHNTCNEDIDWYDLNSLPPALQPVFNKLQADLIHAQHLSAHERCRRLASAPRNPSHEEALHHIQERATDFSQARPELGHATNAAAVVGRRALTQGAFFDRRVFLISYDATQDPDGNILEGILLAVAPVGAGINLEYYFSTVNNERFGCGTKVPHNVTGFFAIMDGTSSDLRTGLPQQMIEIHEAMRLQLLVEAKTTVLEQIYQRQESLRELIAGGWLHLSTKDPDTGDIHVFERGTGFVLWQGDTEELPTYQKSPACYKDKSEPVSPALIKQQ